MSEALFTDGLQTCCYGVMRTAAHRAGVMDRPSIEKDQVEDTTHCEQFFIAPEFTRRLDLWCDSFLRQ